jgi:hypothetical protein
MASLIDNLKPRRTDRIAPLDFADIDRRTKGVEQQQEALRKRVLELDAQLGEVAARAPLSDDHRRLSKEVQAAHEDLHLLDQAREGLNAEREKMVAYNRAGVVGKQRRDCNAAIDNTVADATALAAAAQAFVIAYQRMIIHARRAHGATPLDHVVPDGLLTPGLLRADIGAELFRLSAEASGQSIGRDTLLLPDGANCPDIMLLDNPGAIEPFIEKVRKQADLFREAIKEPAK